MTKTERKRRKKVQTRNRHLIEKYPWLLPRNVWTGKVLKDYNYMFTEFDAMPPGWNKAFGLLLAADIDAELRKYNAQNTFRIVQLKEKYGEIRLYYSGGVGDIDSIINAYSYISQRVCVDCGKLDVPMINDGWMCPTCYNCFKNNFRRREHYLAKSRAKNGLEFAITDENTIKEKYEKYICDTPDDNGEYKLPTEYSFTRYKGDEKEVHTVDISDITEKIRRRRLSKG